MSYQNEKEAINGLNQLITRLRTRKPPAGKDEVVQSLEEWAQREFTDPEKDNSLLKKVKGVLHSDRISQGLGIRTFLQDNAKFLQGLVTDSNFGVFYKVIPDEVMKSESQLRAEQEAQEKQKLEEERESLLEQQRAYVSMGQRLQEIQSQIISHHPDCTSMSQLKQKLSRLGDAAPVDQALLTEYSRIQTKLEEAKLENSSIAISDLMQKNIEHRDYYQGESLEEKMNLLRIEFIKQNMPILIKISTQIRAFESGSPQKVEPKKPAPLSEEEALQKISGVLGKTLDAGNQAVTRHPGSVTNPGKQVRVEYNFLPYEGTAMYSNIAAVKRTLIQLGLLDSNYQAPSHAGFSPFLVIKAPAESEFLNDPNFEAQFSKIYQEQKAQVELEDLSSILASSINDGKKGVIIHDGSEINPGKQVRIEFNFPPHSTNGTYNAVHFNAVQNALTQIGVSFALSKHGDSPFLVIKPSVDGRMMNDPDLMLKFREAYQAQLFQPVVSRQLETITNSTYAMAQEKNIANRLSAEDRLNEGIERVIELAQNGDVSQGIASNLQWLAQNQPLIDGWLQSDNVKHSVKQQLQKLTRPEQFYDRTYKAHDPLVDLVMRKLLQEEKLTLESIKSIYPGGFNTSLEIDNLLRKLRDRDGFANDRSEMVNTILGLLEAAKGSRESSPINQIINKVKNDPELMKLCTPQAISAATIARKLKIIGNEIAYLDERLLDPNKTKRSADSLNKDINELITLAQVGDKQKGIQALPSWFSENKAVIESWLENRFVTHETRQRLQLIVKPEAYFDRKYTAKDPLIEMVWRELLKNEAKMTENPGRYDVCTNVDSLLRKLEGIDRTPLTTHQKAQAVETLLQEHKSNQKEFYNMTPIEEVVNAVLRDKAYLDQLSKQKQIVAAQPVPQPIAKAAATGVPVPLPRKSAVPPVQPPRSMPPVPPPRSDVKAAPVPPPRSDVKAAAPVPPPRSDVKAAAPVPPPRSDVKAAAPVPPPRSDVKAAAPVPPPRSDVKAAAPVPPPRSDVKAVQGASPLELPVRKSFTPSETASARDSDQKFKAELEARLKQGNKGDRGDISPGRRQPK